MARNVPLPAPHTAQLQAALTEGEELLTAERVAPGQWIRERAVLLVVVGFFTLMICCIEVAMLHRLVFGDNRSEAAVVALLGTPFLFVCGVLVNNVLTGWQNSKNRVVAITSERLIVVTTGRQPRVQWARLSDAVTVNRIERDDGVGDLYAGFRIGAVDEVAHFDGTSYEVAEIRVNALPEVARFERLILSRIPTQRSLPR